MEENIITNEMVDQVAEQLVDTVENNVAVVPTQAPVQPVAQPNGMGKNILIGLGGLGVGIGVGAAIDHWVLPLVGKKVENHKAKKAAKKAEKEAKKAAKNKKTESKPESKPEPEKPYDVENFKESDVKIDNLDN